MYKVMIQSSGKWFQYGIAYSQGEACDMVRALRHAGHKATWQQPQCPGCSE